MEWRGSLDNDPALSCIRNNENKSFAFEIKKIPNVYRASLCRQWGIVEEMSFSAGTLLFEVKCHPCCKSKTFCS